MTVKTSDGKTVTGKLVYRDEFTITVMDADGWTRSWPVRGGDHQRRGSAEGARRSTRQQYTEAAMHDVYAFLATLK